MSSQSLSGTPISDTNKAVLPKRFYATWAFVVILAAVLPIAIPYFIWPPQSYERGSFDEPDPPNLPVPLPSNVSVESGPRPGIEESRCHSGVAFQRLQRDSIAKLVLRGAYGIPIGSIEFTCTAERGSRIFIGGGLLLAGLAWFVGMAVVSAPFVLMLERRLAERRGARSLLSRPLSG